MAKGHSKGSSFERKLCKQLSLWWTHGERDDIFWRTSGSGARAKSRGKQGAKTFGQYGDMQATDPIGQPLIDLFTFEFKIGYGKASFSDILDKGSKAAKQIWEKWVHQVQGDHFDGHSFAWALITKRDRREPIIFIPSYAYREFLEVGTHLSTIRPRVTLFTKETGRLIGLPFNQFLKETEPESVLEIMRTLND